jgi:ring-1,2-phenylacetyl-CoA epoxidase subunit PaaD
MVESEVRAAVEGLPGTTGCEVRWLAGGWTAEHVTPAGQRALASVGLALPGAEGALTCPFCGSSDVTQTSGFGSAVCRSAAYCESCRTPVEVMKVKR